MFDCTYIDESRMKTFLHENGTNGFDFPYISVDHEIMHPQNLYKTKISHICRRKQRKLFLFMRMEQMNGYDFPSV